MNHTYKIPYHLLSTHKVLTLVNTNLSIGLSSEEAQNRLLEYGPNVLPSKKCKTFFEKLIEQVNSAIFFVLIVGGALSFGFDHIPDGIVIVCVIILNVFLGIFMEGRAENSTNNLSNMMSIKAVVRRDEEKKEISAENLTYGDLIYLAPGDIVPADSRIIECFDLEVLEAPLTGESHAITKTIDLDVVSKEALEVGKILRENSEFVGNFHLPDDDANEESTRSRSSSINRNRQILNKSVIAIETNKNLSEISNYSHNSDLKNYLEEHEINININSEKNDEDLEAGDFQVDMKDIPLAERTTMVYSGTQIIKGSALCAVVGIGSNCEMGKISNLLNQTIESKTPLLIELDKVGRIISIVIFFIALASLGAALGRDYDVADAFSIAIGVAVAAIPEGLPSCVTITFAIGVSIMAKNGAIIKTLPAVETLGSVSVICSDKTGTLTLNKMTVIEICNPHYQLKLDNDGKIVNTVYYNSENKHEVNVLKNLICGILCNDSSISINQNNESYVQGEPTEKCILELATKIESSLEIKQLIKTYPRSDVIPFDSSKKFMATLHKMTLNSFQELLGFSPVGASSTSNTINVIFLKGASEKIIKFTQTGKDIQLWEDRIIHLAAQGLRVLGTAYKIVSNDASLAEELEDPKDFKLISLLGIIDPPRPEAITAVKVAQDAGITVKMITGDHPVTALAIGKQLGLKINKNSEAIVGSTLDKLLEVSNLEFDKIVLKNDVFARTSPEHKLKIVQSLQRQGIVCSMTGDGVNDAPALKAANIGVAMGIMGTEVAKDAANMILTDDNFSTIIEAIRMGRCTYNNLIKILIYVFPTNGAQAFSILMALAIGIDVPITALQILWVNMVTTICLGLIFAFEKPNKDIMKYPPRRPGKAIFGKFLTWRTLFVTAIMVCSVIGNFQWEKKRGLDDNQLYSVAVNTLFSCQFFYIFNCRNLKANDWPIKYVTNNIYVWYGILFTCGLQMIFTYTYPFQYVFKTGKFFFFFNFIYNLLSFNFL